MKNFMLFACLSLLICQLTYSQTVIFEDDFEIYAPGSHPDAKWIVQYSGQSGTVSLDVAVSGEKSFKLVSRPWWARVEVHPLSSIPDYLYYEGCIYLNQTYKGVNFGFGHNKPPNEYWPKNDVNFRWDDKIFFSGDAVAVELQPWEPYTWYNVKAFCDFINLKGKVWINSILKAEDIDILSRENFEDFALCGANWVGDGTSTVYFDDIKLYIDTTPPSLSISLNPNILWPPNHKLVDIEAIITATDACDPDVKIELVSVVSNEPDEGIGDGDKPNDIQNAEFGTDDRGFTLRAERSGNESGRIYTITYRATDASGNSTEASSTVMVSHDQGNLKKNVSWFNERFTPTNYALFQNQPNPFNPDTRIRYDIPRAGRVTLNIFDIMGKKIRTLVDQHKSAGCFEVIWDGKDNSNRQVTSGMYIFQLQSEKFIAAKKMILLQ